MRAYLLTALVAAAVTYVLTPLARVAARHWGAMAGVRDRDVHAIPTPRLGGVAMLGGVVAALLVSRELPLTRQVFDATDDWRALLLAAVAVTLLGAADDRWELDAVTKLAGQVVAAGLLVLQGVQVLWLPLVDAPGTFVLPSSLGVPLTVLVVLVGINAMNFVDGLDGLAAGIAGIAAACFFLFSYVLSVQEGLAYATMPALTSAILLGVCVGFLPHNFFPARVFMGDSGSMLVGLMLATSAISLTGNVDPSGIATTNLGPLLLPLLLPVAVIFVPLLDMVLAVLRRVRSGRSPFSPDKQHLHHRLLDIGHSHRRAVLLLYAWSALMAFGVLVLSSVHGTWTVAAFVVVLVVASVATFRLQNASGGPVRSP